MSEVNRLEADIGASIVAVPTASRAVVQHEGQEMVGRMRDEAPVRTGELRADIGLRTTADGVEAGSSVDQGFYQEFGTVDMAPQPWAFHNADKAEQAIVDSLEDIPIL